MKQIFCMLLLLLPVLALGQSKMANKLYKQAEKLFLDDKYEEAILYYQKCDSLDKAILEPTSINYSRAELGIACCLNILAFDKSEQGNYQEAIRLGTEAMIIYKKLYGEEHPDYAMSLNNMANYYCYLGNYTEAVRLVTQVMEIYKRIRGEEHHDYAQSLNDLAHYYYDLGNYQEAIRLGTEAMEIRKKVFGKNYHEYAQSLNNLATYYGNLGNYQEAIRLCSEAMEITKNGFGEEHPYYASSLSNLAYYYSNLGNYQEAIRLGSQSMKIRKKVLGEEHPDYATSLSNLAYYYSNLGSYQEAIRLGTQALKIRKKVLGEEHPYYATSLGNLAAYYSDLGNNTEAIRLGTRAMEIRKKFLGEDHPNYVTVLSDLAGYYFKAGKYDEATALFDQSYKRKEALILKTFAYLTNKERSDFWNTYSDFYNKILPSCAKEHPNSTLTRLAYDGQLLSKGLLLNVELEIQNLIEKQGNEQLKQRYYKLRQDRAKLDELYLLAPAERPMDADSLLRVVDNEERILVESSKEIGDYSKTLSVKWTDVQNNLKDNDIALEFVNYKDTADNEVYFVLVLKKGMESPEIVNMFGLEEFRDINMGDYYNTPKLYNLIWKPLTYYLDGVDNVFFSPSGNLHNVAIEFLPDDNGKIFAQRYNEYRLSSTRELVMDHTINPGKKAATYGGIRYDMGGDSTNVRGGGATYLKDTKIESETVASLLRSADYDIQAFSDTVATEESFKKLSGTGLKILHIGTHGFYYAEDEMENYNLGFLVNKNQSDEDRALSCSGLLFAGANDILNSDTRNTLSEGEDGILTAKEISRLDFKGLDLVVLSACQSGLGEVTVEGVFGLQRGFKKAGAQTIVMSLWNVNDKPTQMLMTEFFKNLTAGQPKREAFVNAQAELRKKYPHPQLWAAFVMVDGL